MWNVFEYILQVQSVPSQSNLIGFPVRFFPPKNYISQSLINFPPGIKYFWRENLVRLPRALNDGWDGMQGRITEVPISPLTFRGLSASENEAGWSRSWMNRKIFSFWGLNFRTMTSLRILYQIRRRLLFTRLEKRWFGKCIFPRCSVTRWRGGWLRKSWSFHSQHPVLDLSSQFPKA